MSIENTLERIANNLGRIADKLDDKVEPEKPAKASKPKAEKPKASKPKAEKPAAKEEKTTATPATTLDAVIPQTFGGLKAMVTDMVTGKAPEVMAGVGTILYNDFKVSQLSDLPDDDYEDFIARLGELIEEHS